jgi:hypothetical protein
MLKYCKTSKLITLTTTLYCISEAYRRKEAKGNVLIIFGFKTDEVAEDWRKFDKGQGKFHTKIGHEGPDEEYRYRSTLSLTSAIEAGGWSTPPPGRFNREKCPGTECTREWLGPRAILKRFRKISRPPEFDPRTV